MTTLWPLAAATRASVPMASSASMPGTSSTGQPSSRTTSWMGAICSRSVVGHGRALGLVLGVPGVAEGRPLASNTQAACSAGPSDALAQRFIMATMPWMAPVGKPSGAAQVGHGVEGAVQVAGAVDQQHGLVAHGHIVAAPAAVGGHCVESPR
jgi:hypothetical protein